MAKKNKDIPVVPESDVVAEELPKRKRMKKTRKPRAEAGMMGPMFFATFLLAIGCLALVFFLFNPIW